MENLEQAFHRVSKESNELKQQLKEVEKLTAEKCCRILIGHTLLEQLIGAQYTGGYNGALSTAIEAIRKHFNLKGKDNEHIEA